MTQLRFIGMYVLFLLVLATPPALAWYYEHVTGKALLFDGFFRLFFLFAVFTPVVILPALNLMRLSDKSSGQVLLGTITIRFLFCLVVLLIFMSNENLDKWRFVPGFFYLYLFHSVFEIYCLMRNLRNSKF